MADSIEEGTVLLAAPRGFCAGVERAVLIVERALESYGSPVYVRKQIVHNAYVVSDLAARGAVFVDELDEVPDGAVTVFSAHGVSPAVRAEAASRSLSVIDATCPLVAKVHAETRRYARGRGRILLLGHAGHEEIDGVLGEAPERIHLVDEETDVDALDVPEDVPLTWLSQTTLAVDEVAGTVDRLKDRFPRLADPPDDDICYASQNRQEAVTAMGPRCDLVLVVGSGNSSNSLRLVEVALAAGARSAHLVDSARDIMPEWIREVGTVGVTAGASAPEHLVQGVVQWLAGRGFPNLRQLAVAEETVQFGLPTLPVRPE